jgi:hypothetical protein
MGGFRAVVLVVGISGSVCGCTSHTSQISPFVRNLQTSPQGVIVDSCSFEVQVDRNYFNLFWGHSNVTSRSIHDGQCYRQVVPTEGAP